MSADRQYDFLLGYLSGLVTAVLTVWLVIEATGGL